MNPPSALPWRPLRYDDLAPLHDLLLAAAAADDDDRVEPLADLQRQFDDPWSDAAVDARVALAPAGGLAAFARCFANPERHADPTVHLEYKVHPQWRQGGLESAALDWLEARGAERLSALPATGARTLRAAASAANAPRLALLEGRGYRPLRYFYRMRRDLGEPIPELGVPAGLGLRRYGPDLQASLRTAHNEAFADHWDAEPLSAGEWEQFIIQAQSFRPELTLILTDGPQIAAYSLNHVHAADNARLGRKEAYIGSLGTRRPWRRRGLAACLLAESLRLFRQAGYDHATLAVDSANPSGAVGLYERLGFRVARRFVLLEKPLG